MIVIRLLLVAVLIVIAALGLAWVFTRDAKYLAHLRRVLYFALMVGMISGLFYLVERIVLR